jgi:hypothetical protein
VTGTVVLRGSWDGGRWTPLVKTVTDRAGRYSMKFRLQRRGSLRLRLSTPDGFVSTGAVRVT